MSECGEMISFEDQIRDLVRQAALLPRDHERVSVITARILHACERTRGVMSCG